MIAIRVKVVVGCVGLLPIKLIIAALAVIRKRSKAEVTVFHEAANMQTSFAPPA